MFSHRHSNCSFTQFTFNAYFNFITDKVMSKTNETPFMQFNNGLSNEKKSADMPPGDTSQDFFDFLRKDENLTENFLSVGYLELDSQNAITSVNRAGADLLEIDTGCIVGMLFSDFVHKKDLHVLENAFNSPKNGSAKLLYIGLKNRNCYF